MPLFPIGSYHVSLAALAIAAATLPETLPDTDLRLRRQVRPGAQGRVSVVETTLSNEGSAPAAVGAVPVLVLRLSGSPGSESRRYRDLTYREDFWYGSTYWTGPDWTRVGKDWQHPGDATPSVRRFTAPREGAALVEGRAFKADTNCGDGVRLSIRLGERTVWEAEIEASDATGVEHRLELALRKGDRLRFVVEKRGQYFCDTTRWDPTVAYVGGESYRASEGFSKAPGEENPWGYELELPAGSAGRLPCLRGYGKDLDLRWKELRPGAAVRSSKDELPAWLLADALDRSGLAVAGGSGLRAEALLEPSGDVVLRIEAELEGGNVSLSPGESLALPRVVYGAWEGPWIQGAGVLRAAIEEGLVPALEAELFGPAAAPPEIDLFTAVQADWLIEDRLWDVDARPLPRIEDPVAAAAAYQAASVRHIEKAAWLLADLKESLPADAAERRATELARLAVEARLPGATLHFRRAVYLRARWWKRTLALANPLFPRAPILFAKRTPTSYSHLVMQYFGWRARPGGGLFILERPGHSLDCRDILDGALARGSILEPCLSYDAKRIVFSWVRATGRDYDPAELRNDGEDEGYYHIWEVGVDGIGLRQLTFGPYDDLMPVYLPDGGIVFSSTRRRGYARCFGPQFSSRWHVYTLHRMAADGSDIRTISFHDTNEWFPAVGPDGRILYSRWDYIDRDAVTHQNLWCTYPDGTNPTALWGNATPSPHCTFHIEPIPGTSKIVCIAAPHHSIAAGSVVVLDPAPTNDGPAALTRITPEVPFPEAESMEVREYYEAPWPLSDSYFLVAYSPRPLVWEPGANDPRALGLYLLDRFGNRELLYRDFEIGSTNPIPLLPRPAPPVVPSQRFVPHGDAGGAVCEFGEMILLDVYRGLGDIPRGTVKELRIVEIFPKTTPVANQPPIGLAGEENARAILGTVPVEGDGSARFRVPSGKPILFQALDSEGFAVQTMRSTTYVQPGERLSCIGCHEGRRTTPPAGRPAALDRDASEIDPGPYGGRPFSFVQVVQPILDRHCVRCHGAERKPGAGDLRGVPERGFTASYWTLCGDVNFWGEGTNPENARKALVPRFGARNAIQRTPPGGMYGARGSRLLRMLREGHHDVQLSSDEVRRIAAWIDLNAVFRGSYALED